MCGDYDNTKKLGSNVDSRVNFVFPTTFRASTYSFSKIPGDLDTFARNRNTLYDVESKMKHKSVYIFILQWMYPGKNPQNT